MLLASFALGFGGSFLEQRLVPSSPVAFLHESSPYLNLPRGYGLVTFVLSMTYFWMVFYGFAVVGRARSKYRTLAVKDGEKDAEVQYSFPNLYVTTSGSSPHATAFNCVQRSHQQIMETLPGYLMIAMIAGVQFPVATTILCSLWLYSRMVWAEGYRTGNAANRYSHPFSRFFWQAMNALWVMALLSSVNLVVGKDFFWKLLQRLAVRNPKARVA